jgi:hypothetical protein
MTQRNPLVPSDNGLEQILPLIVLDFGHRVATKMLFDSYGPGAASAAVK